MDSAKEFQSDTLRPKVRPKTSSFWSATGCNTLVDSQNLTARYAGGPMGTPPKSPPATSRLRELSRQLVLSELSSNQGLSRSQLAARTGLSRATVAAVVMELMQQG